MGHADVQSVRVAEAVLSAAGRLRRSFAELMEETEWASYGTESGNPKCANCMVIAGTRRRRCMRRSIRFADMRRAGTLFTKYPSAAAREALKAPVKAAHGAAGLVQIGAAREAAEEIEA